MEAVNDWMIEVYINVSVGWISEKKGMETFFPYHVSLSQPQVNG